MVSVDINSNTPPRIVAVSATLRTLQKKVPLEACSLMSIGTVDDAQSCSRAPAHEFQQLPCAALHV